MSSENCDLEKNNMLIKYAINKYKALLYYIKRFFDLINNLLTKIITILLKLLPTRLSANIKDNIVLIKKMDYPHRDIFLNLETEFEINRLRYFKKEPGTTKWLKTYIKPGDVFYDIGANVGGFSFITYALTNGNSFIYAIEPSFSTFSQLCRNIFINGFEDKIIPIHAALSNKTELINFHYKSLTAGDAGPLHGLEGQPNLLRTPQKTMGSKITKISGSLPILCYSLDDLISQFSLSPPQHMKIDVDGTEKALLFGAKKTLQDPNLISVLLEIHKEFDTKNEIFHLMQTSGFIINIIKNSINVLFVRQ